ncbi:MAG: amino acid permease, partial [Candidatus Sericytochromatia bacterium]|nr:amino acid permease [Candidatus Sericytochromatia bacterium]
MLAKKSLDQLQGDAESSHGLKKSLGALELTLLGIGCIIGTGIFVLTGVAAAKHAGPGIMLSFVLAGMACAFAGLCYAEFAAMIPVAGSAYTYAYATLGEFVAWTIGWDLILEYTVGASAVAIGWSGYLVKICHGIGIDLSVALTSPPGSVPGAIINLPAIIIVLIMTGVLVIGVKESAWFNNIMVTVKLAVVLLFIVMGVGHVNTANWTPLMPFGWTGVLTGASFVFFAYISFDAVSTRAEEAKNPQRDLPIGTMVSLAICTVLYIVVAAIMTGVVPYAKLDVPAPMAEVFSYIG